MATAAPEALNQRELERYVRRIADRWPLERVYQADSLWDGSEMGGPTDVHCYTPAEFGRKQDLPAVRRAVRDGVEVLSR